MGGGTGTGFGRNYNNKIEYDLSFKISDKNFATITSTLSDYMNFNVEERKNGEYFYRRGKKEIIRIRKNDVLCNISFKNVDKTLVKTIEKIYKIK